MIDQGPKSAKYRQCKISVMDTIADPDISFDDNGVSNYYQEYVDAEKTRVLRGDQGRDHFNQIVQKIRKDNNGTYDCVLGVSGGVDSSYLAYLAAQAGLKVLCVHFDNGWNSELAVANIQQIVERCGFELHTFVIDWNEFKDIQLAYFQAHVVDIEAVTDIAIFAALDSITRSYGIKHIIDGRNVSTENTLPKSWYCKDSYNLLDIHRRFGKVKLEKYPLMGPIERRIKTRLKPIQSWPLLNFVDYQKAHAKECIIQELGWRDYGGKHYESVFTRFYQGHILPVKFGIDKRKAHFSDLIFSGQITKQEALLELQKPIYPQELFLKDKEFVLKKLGISAIDFDAYLEAPAIPHSQYALNLKFFDELKFLYTSN